METEQYESTTKLRKCDPSLGEPRIGQKVALTKVEKNWTYSRTSNPLWKIVHIPGKVVSHDTSPGKVLCYRVAWSSGGRNTYAAKHLSIIVEEETIEEPKGEKPMIEKAKELAESTYAYVKPYEKYVGIIALAVIIDHFFLGNKYTEKFKNIAEGLVSKIVNVVEAGCNKLVDAVKTEEDKDAEAQHQEDK